MRRICAQLSCVVLCALFLAPVTAQEAATGEVLESGVQEKVRVVLVEVKLQVRYKSGRPVTDLKPEEVTVLEGGRPQRLASLDSWLTAGGDAYRAAGETTPAPVYSTADEEATATAAVEIPPARPLRRVIFAFDVRNSTIRVREEWRAAAIDWVETGMAEDDLASVVLLRNYPQWVLQPTSNKDAVLHALEHMDLFKDTPNRSRREDITELIDQLQLSCIDLAERGGRDSGISSENMQGLNDTTSCAYAVVRPFIDQWGNETDESLLALRQLTSQLAAVPGRKAMILFSEGIIPDPSDVAVNAVLSIWGSAMINFRQISGSLRRDAYREIGELQRVAAAAELVYFTMDTRSESERGYSNELELQISQARGSLGINPWSEMYEATRSTLSGLAYATGGRPYYGKDDLEQDVANAAASYYGIYTVAYYRSNPEKPGKLKVKISRKGVRFELPSDAEFLPREARQTPLELAVGRPSFSGSGDLQNLPIAVMTLYEGLPLRRGAGGRGCQLGIFLQAQRPDGSVAAERLDTAIVVVPKRELEGLEGRYYDHKTYLELRPGHYRLRARMTDDSNEILGDTFIDLTVGAQRIAPGFIETWPTESGAPAGG